MGGETHPREPVVWVPTKTPAAVPGGRCAQHPRRAADAVRGWGVYR